MRYYALSEQDNESYAFRAEKTLTENQQVHQLIVPDMSGTTNPDVARCKTCGELLNKWDGSLKGLHIVERKYDISLTYDGVLIVSERFKMVYVKEGLIGLIFHRLPDDKGFYSVKSKRCVAFDSERRKTVFMSQCSTCGKFKEVIGATPVYLRSGEVIEGREFVRTDLEFGSDDEKSPIYLCGEYAATILKKAKLKGVELELCE